MSVKADWIAVNWGTTHLRAFAMSISGAVVAKAAPGRGMGQLAKDDFEPALIALIDGWLSDGRRRCDARRRDQDRRSSGPAAGIRLRGLPARHP